MRATSSFHSACVNFTVFSFSPIVTPASLISTAGHAVQAGHRVTLMASMFHLLQGDVRPYVQRPQGSRLVIQRCVRAEFSSFTGKSSRGFGLDCHVPRVALCVRANVIRPSLRS